MKPLREQSQVVLQKSKALKQRFPITVNAVIMGVVLLVMFGIGNWLDVRTAYFDRIFLPLSFCIALLWISRLDKSLIRITDNRLNPLLSRTWQAGVFFLMAVYFLAVYYVATRIPRPYGPVLFWTIFGILALAGGGLLLRLITDGELTKLSIALIGIIAWSAFAGWGISSTAYIPIGLFETSIPPAADHRQSVVEDRKRALNERVTVAVALSDGGYRAATIHAGVLDALDGDGAAGTRIPINYLSTVSGGSIVGSYYALGHRPSEFMDLLKARKPGLPNDLFHIRQFFGYLLSQTMTNSDTYAAHFRRTYFGEATFADVSMPTLIVNATNYVTRHREIFTDRNAAQREIRIADAVAASGAFPGAFEPKNVGGRYYIDGGVVENLGLEGLREFLLQADGSRPRPDVLIISDASKAERQPVGGKKEFVISLLKEASTTSYDALHHKLYRLFTNNRYDPDQDTAPPQPYFQGYQHLFGQSDPHDAFLFVFVLDGTSVPEREYMRVREERDDPGRHCQYYELGRTASGRPCRALQVSELGTLTELDPGEVEMAAWVGRTIANKYREAIRCVITGVPALKALGHDREPAAQRLAGTCARLVSND